MAACPVTGLPRTEKTPNIATPLFPQVSNSGTSGDFATLTPSPQRVKPQVTTHRRPSRGPDAPQLRRPRTPRKTCSPRLLGHP
jgi:hypothetical protein